ncbi:MAG: imidazoleglycerol-phosphate dehydratase HisB [Xanthomonadales bacterium]|nr:imidazoleglycerol-phosphate dehydratase HisB [Xanthomonadales bacterium]NIX13924.1 imidazoleglycerol-phosphate dehydratase HisB [Xanthomonadales bacterium]
MRTAKLERKTKETDIQLEVNLDGSGKHEIETGIGFFDHMLVQIAVHGLFDLKIKAAGDLHIDPHHTVEDCGLALGAAFKQALGDKAGIIRTASATVPMDEALGQVVIDFSGRPYAVLTTAWTSPMVGNLPTTLLEHFFESFATACGANLHLIVHYGKDNHHMAESLFKAAARAMAKAVQIDPRRQDQIPSSKGVL